jgi:hypothetical protein
VKKLNATEVAGGIAEKVAAKKLLGGKRANADLPVFNNCEIALPVRATFQSFHYFLYNRGR